MKITHHLFGHELEPDPTRQKTTTRAWQRYRYVDTKEPVDFLNPRPCKLCGKERTAEGHDPCIPNLEGVQFACCGHGVNDSICGGSYLVLDSGQIIRGPFDHVCQMVYARDREEERKDYEQDQRDEGTSRGDHQGGVPIL